MLAVVAARWKEQFSESAQAVRTAAANPNIRRLELAWMGSISGLWMYTIALSVFAYEEGGAAAVGLVGAIRLFPAAIAAPFAAGLGDRFPREKVLLVAGVLRTLLMVAAALAVFSSVPRWPSTAWRGSRTSSGPSSARSRERSCPCSRPRPRS